MMAPSKLRRRRKGTSSEQRRGPFSRSPQYSTQDAHSPSAACGTFCPAEAAAASGRWHAQHRPYGQRTAYKQGSPGRRRKALQPNGEDSALENRCGQAWFAARRKHAAGSIREAARRPRRAGQTLCMGTSHKLRFRRSIAAVVTCKDEQYTLPAVLRELRRLPLQILVIIE